VANNAVAYNHALEGGGIAIHGLGTRVIGNLLYNNSSGWYGGGIYVTYGRGPNLSNNTIINNWSDSLGGGIYIYDADSAFVTNCIIRDNQSCDGAQIAWDLGLPNLSYCNIQGWFPGEGNIDVDPLFRNQSCGDFHLMSIRCGDSLNSPCIDAGDRDILDSLLSCFHGLGGLRSDMGAYGGSSNGWPVSIEDGDQTPKTLPRFVTLFQNYPNPFNVRTTITFILPQSGSVNLSIYDILGRHVQTLLDGWQQIGPHSITFDAMGLASGAYFYRLRAGERIDSKRMLLLK